MAMNKIDELFKSIMNLPDTYELEGITQENMPFWDSIRHVEFIIKIQRAFKIRFTVEEITQLKSLKEIKENVASKVEV